MNERVMMKTKLMQKGGFTLVEVLVALVVLSVGLLGLASLQAQGLSGNADAMLRTQATLYVYDMVERMRINRDDAISSSQHYEIAYGDTPASTLPTMVKDDLDDWLAEVATLPSGLGSIDISSTSAGTEATVSVQYNDKGGAMTVSVDTGL